MMEEGTPTVVRFAHFRAIVLRRFTLFKRSVKAMITSILMTIVFSALAIVANYLMKLLLKDSVVPYTFDSFKNDSGDLVVSGPDDGSEYYLEYIDLLKETFYNDTGREAIVHEFENRTDLNEWMYRNALENTGPESVLMGVGFNNPSVLVYNLTGYFNGTWVRSNSLAARVMLTRLVWKKEFGRETDFVFSVTLLLEKVTDFVFGLIAPMLIVSGLISVVPMIVSQPIIDIRGEVRQYMMSCGLTLVPYWLATFVVDMLVWTGLVTIVWAIFLACMITAVHDNMLSTWYTFMMMGPSFILFVYCWSFAFASAESATRQLFIIMALVLLVPMIVDIVRQETTPLWLEWVYGLIPHVATQRILQYMLVRVNILKQDLPFYWKDDAHCRAYLSMQLIDIVIYAGLLTLIETVRVMIAKRATKRKFTGYSDVFAQARNRRPVTTEVTEMEREVHESDDFAVKIVDVSRLFFNTAGDPITAVNNVSLGIKDNSVFGFLGANGAGKTTLIKMIMSLLPPSAGNIYIKGVDVNEAKSSGLLSICPQFNSHLCDEMTPREHFRLYGLLHRMDTVYAKDYSERLIEVLDLGRHAEKPVRELSGGNQRKLALALSFFGPADIILLDEPTSSLDPVARRSVHEMITEHRGRKTFMLCTHLLSEAESLCNQISIMIKGCVYTCGSPQYLSQKFGTEYKIDVMLDKSDDEANDKCTAFFESSLPQANLTILRPNVRIYSVPSDSMKPSQIFSVMEEGLEAGSNGYVYYTCSSSSLERVFMEIVHISEEEGAEFVDAKT